MNVIQRLIAGIDRLQQKHPVLGLPIGVIKRFAENDASHQAALITYYGFLSLFPLLLVFTSVVQLVSQGNQSFYQTVMDGVNSYFPVIGDQLSRNIATSTKSGPALAVGLLVALYGARGGADAFRTSLNHLWHVPKKKRAGFPKNILLSVVSLFVGGLGLTMAAVLSASAAGLGRSIIFKLLAIFGALIILTPTFYWLFRINLPRSLGKRNLMIMAIWASLVVLIVQNMGSYLVTRQLRTLSPLYGTFAIVLGLLFWIYLQAMLVLYVVQIRIVRSRNLWPRSISGQHLTEADKRLLGM